MRVLVTGGAGYIGSHIVHALADAGHTPLILDSLYSGRRELIPNFQFYHGDIADVELVKKIIDEHHPTVVIHCAARIIVPESQQMPAVYYQENVVKTLTLLETLQQHGVHKFVFSSSASLYASPPNYQVDETSPVQPHSPYARTKLMVEYMLEDLAHQPNSSLQAIALRYFNPIGADDTLRTGTIIEHPTHVLGKIIEAALGSDTAFTITGTDWPTRDGTGIRDYINIIDLASAHVQAVEHFDAVIDQHGDPYCVINVGTGTGTTVKELVDICKAALTINFSVHHAPPRHGDVAGAFAICDRARNYMNWTATHTIQSAIQKNIQWLTVRKERLGY